MIVLVSWTLKFAKVSRLSQILCSARFNSLTLLCVLLAFESQGDVGEGRIPCWMLSVKFNQFQALGRLEIFLVFLSY